MNARMQVKHYFYEILKLVHHISYKNIEMSVHAYFMTRNAEMKDFGPLN